MTASKGGSASAFGAQDFIAFDFNDLDDQEQSSSSAPGAGSRQSTSHRNRRAAEREAAFGKGKKRKVDDWQDDGRTKKERQIARSRHTPWSADVDWSRCGNGAEALHRELMAFDAWVAPTMAEHETRCMVIELIRRAVKSQFRDAEVFSFGSQETKLYLPKGDLDLVVVSDFMESMRRDKALHLMAAGLRRHNLATDVQVIARARIPIIKFVTTYAKLKVDISINTTNGPAAAKYVNSWLRKWPHIRPLIMVIKHLLVQRGMSEVFSGGLGSYSVIIMVINFLQLHPKIQRGEIDPARNLGVLLLEFLELYGKNFGYDNCGISIRGRGGYFSKARRGWKDERRPFMLCIEDPHDPTNDISKGSYGIINVRSTLAGAFDILTAAICSQANESNGQGWDRREASQKHRDRSKHMRFSVDSDSDSDEEARRALLRDSWDEDGKRDQDPNSLLGTILGVSNPIINQRKEMESLFYSGQLQNKLGRPAPPSSPPPATPSVPRAMREGGAARPSSQRNGRQNPSGRDDSGVVSITSKTNGADKARRKAGSPPTSSSRKKRARASSDSSVEIVDEEELAASQGFEFGEGRASKRRAMEATKGTKGSDEEDSRYSVRRGVTNKSKSKSVGREGRATANGIASSSSSTTSPQKRARHAGMEISQAELEDLSQSAPSSFVSEDDESEEGEEDEGDDRILLPTVSHSNSHSSSATSSPRLPNGVPPSARGVLRRISSRTKNDFWTAKGVDTFTSESSLSPPPSFAGDRTGRHEDVSDS